jgi:hypothetical protein
MPGDEVTYTYIVGPVSAYEATVEVTDDKLGVVAADLLVPILGVVEFTATTTIFETTTNTARITAATSVACEIPSAGASVTVTVPGVATPTATPTPTAEPTATATATPPPGTSDCLCEVQNINPNQVVLQNVASGGKGSSATRKMTLIVHAVDAPGATCDPGEFSEPTSVNLMMVDDNGDAVFNDGKTIVCGGGGGTTNVKLDVFFQGPLNCEGGTVPPPKPGFSLGTITSTGTGSAGSTDYVESTSIKCFE